MYKSNFFFFNSGRKLDIYQINKVDIELIQSLKSHISNKSGYYKYMLQWRIHDNGHLTKKELNRLYPAMQFITMSATINKDFISKNKIKNHHIALLRRLYLNWNDYKDDSCISMELKMPFGNSNVYADIRQEVVRFGDKTTIDQVSRCGNDWSYEIKVLKEFVIFLDKLFKEAAFELKVNCFKQKSPKSKLNEWSKYLDNNYKIHTYLYKWEPDITEMREEKLKQIITLTK
jgi:hypothetical protein